MEKISDSMRTGRYRIDPAILARNLARVFAEGRDRAHTPVEIVILAGAAPLIDDLDRASFTDALEAVRAAAGEEYVEGLRDGLACATTSTHSLRYIEGLDDACQARAVLKQLDVHGRSLLRF